MLDCWTLFKSLIIGCLGRKRTHLLGPITNARPSRGGRRTEFPLGAKPARVESSRVSANCYACPSCHFNLLKLVNLRVARAVGPRFSSDPRTGYIGCTQPQTLTPLDPSTSSPLATFPSARSHQAAVYSQLGHGWHHCRTAPPPKTSGSAPWQGGPQHLRGIWNPPASTSLLGIAIGAWDIQVPAAGGSQLRLNSNGNAALAQHNNCPRLFRTSPPVALSSS